MVDRHRDGGQHLRALALGRDGVEAVGKFLGDEAGGQLAGAPARMRHQRRQERNVVADAVDDKCIERVGLRVDRLLARGRVGDQLGDHRIVVDRNLAALIDAGVVAQRDAVGAVLLRAGGSA